MGIWHSKRGKVSDEMADILSEALERIGNLKEAFTIVDLADAIEFITYGFLIVEINPKLQEVIDHSIVGKNPNPPTASTLKVSEIDSVDFRNLPNRGDIKWLSQWHKEREGR